MRCGRGAPFVWRSRTLLKKRWLISLRLRLGSFGSDIGVVLVTIAVTWFYKLGGNLNRFFWIISIIVGGSFLWRLMRRHTSLFHRIAEARLEFLVMVGFAALIVLPALLGGEQFTFFRGNHYDSFNYLQAAITYRKLSYFQVSQLNTVELVRLGLFKFGQDNLRHTLLISSRRFSSAPLHLVGLLPVPVLLRGSRVGCRNVTRAAHYTTLISHIISGRFLGPVHSGYRRLEPDLVHATNCA